eukprot:m.66005 g.66005  ORF g.66005 m.66005 type:complete len:1182 (-) comp7600_c0_seq4:112-3657(-)
MSLPVDFDLTPSRAQSRGWAVELNSKAQWRKKLPGWKSYATKRSHELVTAVCANNFRGIRELLRDGADVNYVSLERHGRTCLHIAATLEEPECDMLQILLDSGALVNITDDAGNTALHVAASHKCLEAVQLLLLYGASYTTLNDEGMSALHVAARLSSPKIVSTLLEAGALNDEGSCGKLPLVLAIDADNQPVAHDLLKLESLMGAQHWKYITEMLLSRFEGKQYLPELFQKIMPQAEPEPQRKASVAPESSQEEQGGKKPEEDEEKEAQDSVPEPVFDPFHAELKKVLRKRVSKLFCSHYNPRDVVLARKPEGSFGFTIVLGATAKLATLSFPEDNPPLLQSGESVNNKDIITTVNGKDVTGMPLEAIVDMVRKSSTTVRLTLVSSSELDTEMRRKLSVAMEDAKQEVQAAQLFIANVPVTTRKPRGTEKHGVDYNFVSRSMFYSLLENGHLSEWGERDGHMFGVLSQSVRATPHSASLQDAKINFVTLKRLGDGTFGITVKSNDDSGLPIIHAVAKVVNVVESSMGPLRFGDRIFNVNGINIAGFDINDVQNLLKGNQSILRLGVFCYDPNNQMRSMSKFLLSDVAMDDPILKDAIIRISSSIPYTTRAPAEGEVDGTDFHFVTVESFKESIESDDFVEWTCTEGVYYGTKRTADKPALPRNATRLSLAEALERKGTIQQPTASSKPSRRQSETATPATTTAAAPRKQSEAGRKSSLSTAPTLVAPSISEPGPTAEEDENGERPTTPPRPSRPQSMTIQKQSIEYSPGVVRKSIINPAAWETEMPGLDDLEGETDADSTHFLTTAQLEFLKKIRQEFEDKIDDLSGENNLGFSSEYRQLGSVGKSHSKDASMANQKLNRYTNIAAYDHSRVILKEDGSGDFNEYINANWIEDQNGQHMYIASQGPTQRTFVSFWQMIWQQSVPVIVMVTNEVEKGKVKCDRYWPEEGCTKQFGRLTVRHERKVQHAHFVQQEFSILSADSDAKHTVKHFAFTAWPDHGTPKQASELLLFRTHINRAWYMKRGHPIVVHCSAGVGRSGTYIAIDRILNGISAKTLKINPATLEDATTNFSIDVLKCASNMRESRNLMIQTLEQYIFTFAAILVGVRQLEQQSLPLMDLCHTVAKLDVELDEATSTDDFDIKQSAVIGLDDLIGEDDDDDESTQRRGTVDLMGMTVDESEQ